MDAITQISQFGKAISEPNRLRLLMLLQDQEVCVCHLISILALSPSTISEHLSVLKSAGLVQARKEGKWIHYSRASDSKLFSQILELAQSELTLEAVIKSDQQKLYSLIKKGATLCN